VLLLSSAAYRVSWRVRAGGALRRAATADAAAACRFTPGTWVPGSPARACTPGARRVVASRTRGGPAATG